MDKKRQLWGRMTAAELKTLRKSRQQTRDEMAHELGCSSSAIVHWESGTRSIPDWVVSKLLENTQVKLPLKDLHHLLNFCQQTGEDFETVLAGSIRDYLQAAMKDMGDNLEKPEPPVKGPVVYPFPNDQGIKVADSPDQASAS